MASKVATMLELLSDGRWHTLKEIQRKMKLGESQLQKALVFLKEFGFIDVDNKKKQIKLEEAARKLLTQEATP